MNVKKVIAATVATATLGVGAASVAPSVASAMSPPTSIGAPNVNLSDLHLSQHARRRLVRRVVHLSAKTIGIPAKDLVSQLKASQSIADVARAHNVDPRNVVDALVTAGDTRIDKALANHHITAERATALKAEVPTLAANVVNAHWQGK